MRRRSGAHRGGQRGTGASRRKGLPHHWPFAGRLIVQREFQWFCSEELEMELIENG
jgi:hypothetical protein